MPLAIWRTITLLESVRIVLTKKVVRMARTFGEMFGHSNTISDSHSIPEKHHESSAAPQSQILITIKNYGKEFNAKAVCVNCGKTFFNEWGGVIPGDEFGFFVTDHNCTK